MGKNNNLPASLPSAGTLGQPKATMMTMIEWPRNNFKTKIYY